MKDCETSGRFGGGSCQLLPQKRSVLLAEEHEMLLCKSLSRFRSITEDNLTVEAGGFEEISLVLKVPLRSLPVSKASLNFLSLVVSLFQV